MAWTKTARDAGAQWLELIPISKREGYLISAKAFGFGAAFGLAAAILFWAIKA